MRRIEKSTRAVLDEEAWVLRDQASAGNAFQLEKAVQDLSDAARRQFLQDYVVRWRDFLSSITIRHFSGLDDAAQLAKALAEPDSALAFLIRFAGRETSLTGNYEGDVDSWIDRQKQRLEKGRRAIVGEISGQNYRNKVLPEHVVDDYFNAVRRMGQSLNQAGTTGEGGGNPLVRLFEPLYRQLSLVSGAIEAGQVLPGYDAFGRLRADAAKQPEPVRGIMLDLVNLSGSMTAEKSGATLSRGAEGSSRALCQSGVAGRYPLVRSAKNEVGTEDFKRLFGPQGAMSSFFDSQLAQYVDTASLPWKARRLEGLSGNLINPQIIRSYEQAKTIRDTFFTPQGQLGFSMVIRPVDMDASIGEAILEIGGEQMRYTHGSSIPKKFDWSPSNARMVVRLQLRGLDGRIQHLEYLGSWAIFKFFDAGERKKFAEDKQELVYRTPLGSVTFEFQALTNDFPLWSSALSQFRCPSRS